MDGTSRETLDQATRRERYIAAVIGAGIGLHEADDHGLNDVALGNYRLLRRLVERDDFDDEEFRKELTTQAALLAELRRSLKRR